MPVMLTCEGVMPERWIGYAKYINHLTSSKAELMRQWPNPESVLQAVASPELEPWRQSIKEGREAYGTSLPENAWLVTLTTPHYPPLLSECGDAPACLFGAGDFGCFDAPAIAIVGSRRPSLDGLRLAETFACELARAGFVIVSGLAQGIDTAAHKGALSAGGRTIAVMATGIDTIYPASNRGLSADIAKAGALVTEFLPGSAPKRHHFRRRNRTISGMSIATVVIEAGVPSGTLITATAAAEQGRDVYALPWSINHGQGEGCLKLLLEGAALATCPQDVIEGSCWSKPISVNIGAESYGGSRSERHQEAGGDLSQSAPNPETHDGSRLARGDDDFPQGSQVLNAEQQHLLELLGDGRHCAESLAVTMDADIRNVQRLLTSLELAGVLRRHRDSYCKW